MTIVGIDVAKDKHDCYIVNSDGEVLAEVFTIPNDQIGFNLLFQKLQSVAPDLSKVKVGLEATGHYSYNLLGFILDKGLHTYVINPLHTNLFRKAEGLRRTKTDPIDAHTIAGIHDYCDLLTPQIIFISDRILMLLNQIITDQQIC